jgi:hypothetical protein
MICWHVCSVKKLNKYLKTGHINPPVRAWETLEQAQRFSVSTGRRVILRLRLPKNTPKLEGHKKNSKETPMLASGRNC